MTQLDLQHLNEGLTGAGHPATSFAASEKGDKRLDREIVYEHLAACGMYGATDDEIQDALGWTGIGKLSRPRRNQLVTAGRVKASGTKRLSRMGNRATVWVTT